MHKPEPTSVPLAVRIYPISAKEPKTKRKPMDWRRPNSMLVFDTETRTDATQRLTFGSYRYLEDGRCLEEGLFYADDLPAKDRRVLEKYAGKYRAETAGQENRRLKLLTLSKFVDLFYDLGFRTRCLIVGFNLPFDLSRIAREFSSARDRFAGGFSLGLWIYCDEQGEEHLDSYRPRICIKHIDNKRALKGFTARNKPDRVDLIPEGSRDGTPEPGYKFRGHFLDARTLAFALTDRGYSLANACKQFAVEHGKQQAAGHGEVTSDYIDYNRRDVQATSELALKLLDEYDQHPISLQPTKAYSPASIGKAYLHAMGIEPILQRQPDFPRRYLGYAETAFYGGRTSAHIRKVAVPVVYTDFLSMYPTVNSLMDLWRFVIAQEIKVVDHCDVEIAKLLKKLTADDLFKPATWRKLAGFVKVIPDGDILPSRGKYSIDSNDWQVGVNYLYAAAKNPAHGAMWFSLPDVVSSVILTGRVPKIVDAFRIEAHGKLSDLQPTKLRGIVDVHPGKQDFFRVVIEQRKSLARRDCSSTERERLDKALKVLANASSYGIYAEMNRTDTDDEIKIVCHGIDEQSFTCRVAHPDDPGEYCFPPLATLITGGARLMLSLLERCVTDLGGTYAMEDTDSMAIVATEKGGNVPLAVPGGEGGNKSATVKALSWKEAKGISDRFAALNPYDRTIIPGSILKIEDDNFDQSHAQRQLYCYAISAKRYALFVKDKRGEPALFRQGVNNNQDRWSKHGLGHLLNPTDPESEDRDWIGQAWLNMIREGLGLPAGELGFEQMPGVGRVSVSSPAIMRALMGLNHGKPYGDQIKPFNFVLTCHVKPLGHPLSVDESRFHLIGAYESDPRKWLVSKWVDQYSGNRFEITTEGPHGDRTTARVKTYGEVLREYRYHPEAKCADADGNVCRKQTIGLLRRRHIHIERVRYIGKESNCLEDVESGTIHDDSEVYTEYVDPARDEWTLTVRPSLIEIPLAELVEGTGMSRRALIELRAGRSRPHPKNQRNLMEFLRALSRR